MSSSYTEFLTATTNTPFTFPNSKTVAHAFMLVKAVTQLDLTKLDSTTYAVPSPDNLLVGVIYPFAFTKVVFDVAGAVVVMREARQNESLVSG